tara:strand:+ start:57 stop:446 length:390 start_codon:yes stop_codon:yes gene_type:complete
MTTKTTNKSSVIEFEDEHTIRNPITGIREYDDEEIRCNLPLLEEGENIVLNAWGSYEAHNFDEYRRRLGIYSVVLRQGNENPHYLLRLEEGFSSSDLVSKVLSSNTSQIADKIKGLKYIELDRDGNVPS